ncbi:hypothetical protein GMSM_37450 [Geomonas sp. Red276]
MKKLTLSLALAFLVAFAGVASAEEGMSRLLPNSELAAVIGYKAWVADWKTSEETIGNAYSGHQYSSNTKVLNIPVVSLKYQNAFVSGSFIPETEFKFTDFTDGSTFNGKRSEWDAQVGYFLWSPVAVTVGYKSITQKFGSLKYEFGGPTIGISGKADIKYGLAFYGSGGFGWLDVDRKGSLGTDKGDSNYFLGELGLAYKPQALPLSVQVGYRLQYVDTKYNKNGLGENTDITRGLVAGLNLIF